MKALYGYNNPQPYRKKLSKEEQEQVKSSVPKLSKRARDLLITSAIVSTISNGLNPIPTAELPKE